MVQISSFHLTSDSKQYNDFLSSVQGILQTTKWSQKAKIEDETIVIPENSWLSYEEYQSIALTICKHLITNHNEDFLCKSEFFSDDLEIHESIVYKNQYFAYYYVKEVYAEDSKVENYYFGQYKNQHLQYEEVDVDSYDMEEVMCPYCGEYIKKHKDTPFSYCPICDCVEVYEEEIVPESNSPWLEHEFKVPLGVTLPSVPVSVGQDWITDCEEDHVFGLHPSYYHNKNQYNAALRLCKACDGWYRYDSEEEKERIVSCYREIINAKEKEPMWYYSLDMNNFDWLRALRECNPRYKDKLLSVDSVWDLFNKLGMRSCLEKADCFEWFVNFFGDYLKYEGRYSKLSDTYVQGYYDNSLETILYLREYQIDILTKSMAQVSGNAVASLARAAAGLIRMGKKDVGLSLYKKAFAMVWNEKTTLDDKKNVMNSFVDRLAQGYENESYIDEDIVALLEKQCQKYSDGAWTSKIRMSLGR